MTTLEIKGNEDKVKVAGILISNGYTVRIVTVKKDKRSVSVLQYMKNHKNQSEQSDESSDSDELRG